LSLGAKPRDLQLLIGKQNLEVLRHYAAPRDIRLGKPE
jgi:hypothetical protein